MKKNFEIQLTKKDAKQNNEWGKIKVYESYYKKLDTKRRK